MPLSTKKKVLFWLITLLFPVIVLLIIEVGFRVAGYNEDAQELFIELPGKPDFFATNPKYAARYFPDFLPQIAPSPFLKVKDQNTFRVFVFGGSSTQGFPYNFYNAFSGTLERKLLLETQGLNIEVINLGMTAVNSYVLWDLKEEVMKHEPDAVIVYAGHNEYYGSFGVGSSQFGLGRSVKLKRLILTLKDLRLYQFFEELVKPDDKPTQRKTLMARVVKESEIKLNDKIYESGLKQFRSNISDFSEFFGKKEVPIFIGLLASNLKGQAPLSDNEEALAAYNLGTKLFRDGKKEEALASYVLAKELDGTRFRAPNDINTIIRDISNKYELSLVDIETLALESSVSGIPDNSIFTDHLHPTWDFNQAIGTLFFNEMRKHSSLKAYYLPNALSKDIHISQFEETYSTLPIKRLTSGFPFTKGISAEQEYSNFQRIVDSYKGRSHIDSIATDSWQSERQVALALTDVINYSSQKRDTISVISHYLELSYWQIYNEKLLKKGVNYAVNRRDLDHYTATLLHLILSKGREDQYFVNSLSAIYLLNQDLDRAGFWLNKSEKMNSESQELNYNFARFYVLSGDTTKARDYYNKFVNLSQGQ
ncbi:MAG: hypothetical protein BalsKO_31500 [Balneolaceae bacterium]